MCNFLVSQIFLKNFLRGKKSMSLVGLGCRCTVTANVLVSLSARTEAEH